MSWHPVKKSTNQYYGIPLYLIVYPNVPWMVATVQSSVMETIAIVWILMV